MKEEIKRLRELALLAVDLAFTSAIYNLRDVAREIMEIEEMVDELAEEVSRQAIRRAIETGNEDQALVIVGIANALEQIADASVRIAETVLSGMVAHEVLRSISREADEWTLYARWTGPEMSVDQLEERFSVVPLGVKRGGEWHYAPEPSFTLRQGDLVILKGTPEALDDLLAGYAETLEEHEGE